MSQAGGIDFIHDGQTVVLKPNLPTVYQDNGETLASPTVSGINTDWRVTKAVADLVRAKNPTGKILVMEGSTFATTIAYAALGYTSGKLWLVSGRVHRARRRVVHATLRRRARAANWG